MRPIVVFACDCLYKTNHLSAQMCRYRRIKIENKQKEKKKKKNDVQCSLNFILSTRMIFIEQ